MLGSVESMSKPDKKPEPQKKKLLTPAECALLARGYEESALKIQELYQMGSSVSEAVKSMLARANFIKAGKIE